MATRPIPQWMQDQWDDCTKVQVKRTIRKPTGIEKEEILEPEPFDLMKELSKVE
jgi:beta-galactosidase GanA